VNAQKLAEELKALGINVISVTEPQEHVDGLIHVSEHVQVQVPMYDDYEPGVVRVMLNGEHDFMDSRSTTKELVEDIQSALRDEAAVFAA
jgi:hypothetical protein